MTTPNRTVANAYVEITNRGAYAELRTLFADNAVFFAPQAQVFHGPHEIGAFYGRFLATITPKIRISSYVEQGDDCVWELEALIAGETDYRLGAIDHATLDADGKIVRFAVFTK